MKARLLTHLAAPLVVALMLIPMVGTYAQQASTPPPPPPQAAPRVDLGAFTKEVMGFHFEGDQTHLAIWFPYEFFVAVALSDGTGDRASMEREMGFMRDYIPLVIQSEFEQPDGTKVFATEAELRSRAVLKLADGSEVAALTSVPPKISALLAVMRNVIQDDGGQLSRNMHVLVFPSSTRAGRKIVETSQKDILTLVLKPGGRFKEASFNWRTPFDALTRPADCPRCRAGVSAKWTYCPFCGQKLPH
ncbi:MAG TPA: zinc ribbon domain-containing protein [Pyrinomonadaceae bacterium]|nr:zinc ribbon domain-containing protein [Pyrinomonadaceae bacterium]